MSSRMDKYRENPEFIGSRARKNEELYQEIIHDDLEDINLESNAHVIGENENNIDIEKIRELLEKKYPSEQNSRKTRPLVRRLEDDSFEKELEEEKIEETKEYDINAIIEKAKLDKDVDYERERLKKIRDTQYDILKGLDLEKEEDKNTSVVTSQKENLMNLINTITEKELTREMNPLDLFPDLKGSENTVVLEGIKEKIEDETSKKVEETVKNIVKDTVKEETKKEIDKTFYTNSMSFTKSDFDDFNDLKEGLETNKILVKILLVLVALALLAGILFLANHVFEFNWF